MTAELKFKFNTDIDDNLSRAWEKFNNGGSAEAWVEFLQALLPGCDVSCDSVFEETRILFESEEHKNWFLLKWG